MSEVCRTEDESLEGILAGLSEDGVVFNGVCACSQRVRPGEIFIAMPGHQADGRQFIAQAIDNGASAILWEDSDGFVWKHDPEYPNRGVSQLRSKLGALGHRLCGFPAKQLKVIAVTGTNGKTTISSWVAQLLEALQCRSAVIGTLGVGRLGTLRVSRNTTPDALYLARDLQRFVKQGIEYVALEASSIGIDAGRLNGLSIDTVVFSNVSRDHLDYHGCMEDYIAAKEKLFQWEGIRSAVINIGDPVGMYLVRSYRSAYQNLIGVGVDLGEDCVFLQMIKNTLLAHRIKVLKDGLEFLLNWNGRVFAVQTKFVGVFNITNLLCAMGVLLNDGFCIEDILPCIGALSPPVGRLQRFGGEAGMPTVIVDYAHTPAAFEQVLVTLTESYVALQGGRLIVVFGCGGDRDKGKRELMGSIAERHADCIIVTSDNPRSELPERIIEDITRHLKGSCKQVIKKTERKEAILMALESANPNDVVLVAGKGGESYQVIEGVRYPFSDLAIVSDALQNYAQVFQSAEVATDRA